MIDRWGAPLQASTDATVSAWHDAWDDAMHFVGDPFDTLSVASRHDESFAMGAAFRAVYKTLGGCRLDDPGLRSDVEELNRRASAPHEKQHARAINALTQGNFSTAGLLWDAYAAEQVDFASVRFAHDVWLHVGDAERRLKSSSAALERWQGRPNSSWIEGQLSFALEEAGHYDQARAAGEAAIEADPLDMWARHSLAHVFESNGQPDVGREFLEGSVDIWAHQPSLSVHVWWHLALFHLTLGNPNRVLEIFDTLWESATTAFRLCDASSLLWRCELQGIDVGARWNQVADAFEQRAERHTCGFIDLHMALTFLRCDRASEFFVTARTAGDDHTENGRVLASISRDLVAGIANLKVNPRRAQLDLQAAVADAYRIGGSIAQRDIIQLTIDSLDQPCGN